jgi:hypothetical protein
MKGVIGFVLRAFGIFVYLVLIVDFVVRIVTGYADPLVPVVAFILISGFSALFALVGKLTEAVSALVTATNEEVGLLLSMSDATDLIGRVPQKDHLN